MTFEIPNFYEDCEWNVIFIEVRYVRLFVLLDGHFDF